MLCRCADLGDGEEMISHGLDSFQLPSLRCQIMGHRSVVMVALDKLASYLKVCRKGEAPTTRTCSSSSRLRSHPAAWRRSSVLILMADDGLFASRVDVAGKGRGFSRNSHVCLMSCYVVMCVLGPDLDSAMVSCFGQVLNVCCVFGVRIMFMPDLTKLPWTPVVGCCRMMPQQSRQVCRQCTSVSVSMIVPLMEAAPVAPVQAAGFKR